MNNASTEITDARTLNQIFDVREKIDPAQSIVLKELVIDIIQSQTETIIRDYIENKIDRQADDRSELISSLLNNVYFIMDLEPEKKERIFFHPSYSYFLKGLKRYSEESPVSEKQLYFLSSLIDFTWCDMAKSGSLKRPVSVMTDRLGGLRCPAYGKYIELGKLYGNGKVDIYSRGENFFVRCSDGLTITIPFADIFGLVESPYPTIDENGYAMNEPIMLFDEKVEFWSRDPWLRARFSGTNQRNDGIDFWGVDDHVYPDSPDPISYSQTATLLKTYWPEQYNDFKLFTRVIVPMDSGPDTRRGFTVSSRQGAIYIDVVDPEDMAENLVHENAHLKLRYLQMLDDLMLDPYDDSKRFPVAWRNDPRPLPGILEGLYVFTHITEYLVRRQNQKRSQLPRLLKNILSAQEILERNAEFTSSGKVFMRSMAVWIDDLSSRIE